VKGIILAGGTGSRLWPITHSVSKQLLPVYDKPMIYYPISTLMLAGIREILIITTPQDQPHFEALLGSGSDFGVSFQYEIQSQPKGLAQAFTIGEEFLSSESCMMILGDNIFHGAGLGRDLISKLPNSGAHVFTYEVTNPSDYGVLVLDSNQNPKLVIEKPKKFISNLAITGLYFFDEKVVEIAKEVKPSLRGEFEIVSIIESYLTLGELSHTQLSRGTVWLDTGNPGSMNDAANYFRAVEERSGLKVACLEEVAYLQGFISQEKFNYLVKRYSNSAYGKYLQKVSDLFNDRRDNHIN
jgi:glucose-1-phosphate thymidylyltransferase